MLSKKKIGCGVALVLSFCLIFTKGSLDYNMARDSEVYTNIALKEMNVAELTMNHYKYLLHLNRTQLYELFSVNDNSLVQLDPIGRGRGSYFMPTFWEGIWIEICPSNQEGTDLPLSICATEESERVLDVQARDSFDSIMKQWGETEIIEFRARQPRPVTLYTLFYQNDDLNIRFTTSDISDEGEYKVNVIYISLPITDNPLTNWDFAVSIQGWYVCGVGLPFGNLEIESGLDGDLVSNTAIPALLSKIQISKNGENHKEINVKHLDLILSVPAYFYQLNDIQIVTSPITENEEYIHNIQWQSGNGSTMRDIRINDPVSKVIQAYGDGEWNGNELTYALNEKSIAFTFTNAKVNKIVLNDFKFTHDSEIEYFPLLQ